MKIRNNVDPFLVTTQLQFCIILRKIKKITVPKKISIYDHI